MNDEFVGLEALVPRKNLRISWGKEQGAGGKEQETVVVNLSFSFSSAPCPLLPPLLLRSDALPR